MTPPVRLLLSDIDGTLVTSDKTLTPRTIEAVRALRDADILFSITSSRPPRGMSMFVTPLTLTAPLAAFNGGMFVDAQLRTLEQRTLKPDLVQPAITLMDDHDMDVWVYQHDDWFVLDRDDPHTQREARAVQFEPTEVKSFDGVSHAVSKIVGVSDDPHVVAAAHVAVMNALGGHASISSSQSYYLDVTHLDANKGCAVGFLAEHFGISPQEIATIGDGPNDVSMFQASGYSIAMGNGTDAVRHAATVVTSSNDDEGFARAVERFILGS